MKIIPQNIKACISPVKFASTNRQVYKDKATNRTYDNLVGYNCKNCEMLYSNYTQFFRNDLSRLGEKYDWQEFVKLIAREFEDAKNVNVYDFGASDGSEAYSFIISLIENLGDEANKFFPIKAYDVDKVMVRQANSGLVHCDSDDMNALYKNTSDNLEKYFLINEPDYYEEGYYFPFELKRTEIFDNLVKFNFGDFTEKLDEVKGKNNIIFCRNFWPYLPFSKRKLALEKMAQNLKAPSLIVVGHYDGRANIDEWLFSYGFKRIDKYVFEKISDKN